MAKPDVNTVEEAMDETCHFCKLEKVCEDGKVMLCRLPAHATLSDEEQKQLFGRVLDEYVTCH